MNAREVLQLALVLIVWTVVMFVVGESIGRGRANRNCARRVLLNQPLPVVAERVAHDDGTVTIRYRRVEE